MLLDRIVVSAENRARIVDAAEIAYREAGEVIFEEVPRDETAERQAASIFGGVRVQELPSAGQGAGAAAVQLQQSIRGVSAVPGIWQHGGLRPEPGDSGQGAEPERMARSIRGTGRSTGRGSRELRKQAAELGVPLDVPWRELPEAARETVLRGKGQL